MKEMALKIKKISKTFGEGNSTRKSCRVETLDTKQEMDMAFFINDEEWTLKEGDELVAKVSVGEYNGKPSYSTALNKITKWSQEPKEVKKDFPPKKEVVKEATKEVDWDSKDRRMVRMNALSHSTELMKSVFEQGVDDRVKEVIRIAKLYEEYVYGG